MRYKHLRFALVSSLAMLCGTGFAANSWEKATSLSVGDVVLLAVDNGTVAKELSGFSDTSTPYGTVEDYDGTPNGVYPLSITAGSGEGSFAFKTSGDTYLSWSSGNSLKTDAEVADASSWTIVFDGDGNATITNVGTTDRVLQYNASNPRFACYTSSQTKPIIWKQVAEVEPDPDPEPTIDFSALNTAIAAAQAVITEGKVSAEDIVSTLNTAIETAQAALSATSQEDVDAAVGVLNAAVTTALEAQAAADFVPVVADGTYYIYNVEAKGFLVGANNWGTRASIAKTGGIEFESVVTDGKYELKTSATYPGKHLGFNGYVDNADANQNWIITPVEGKEGVFTLSTDGTNLLYWDGGEATTTSVGEPSKVDNAYWKFISKADRLASLADASLENPLNATFLINNPDFSRSAITTVWNAVASNQNLAGGPNENCCAESWQSSFTLSQEVALPNGVYILTAQAALTDYTNLYDGADYAVVYAGETTAPFYSMEGSDRGSNMTTLANSFAAGKYVVTLDPVQVTEGTLTIGVRGTRTNTWCIWDNFQLTYYGTEASLDDVKNAAIIAELKDLRAKATELKSQVEVASVVNALEEVLATTADVSGAEAITAAIATVKAAVENAEAYVKAKDILADMKELVDATNVYTEEALNEYYSQWVAKYEAGTLTATEANSLQYASKATGWHAAITVDNFLLSAWDTNPDFVDAPYYINSWSVEGDTDGSDFRVPFFEYFADAANSLGEKTLTATLNGIAPGNYDVTVFARACAKNGVAATDAYGISLVVNDGTAVDVTEGQTVNQFNYGVYTATGTVGEDGVLKIQFVVAADNNVHWFSFKNVKYAVAIDYTALNEAITNAKTAAEAMTNANAKAYLEAAIADAEAVVAAGNKTQEEVNAALATLNSKSETAKAAEAYKFGQYAIYSWESLDGIVCEKGGVVSYENGDGNRLNYPQAGYYTICLNGKKANINDADPSANAGYMLVTLDEALAEGDVISISAFLNKNESKSASAWLIFETGATADVAFGDEANVNEALGGVVTTKTYVVTAEAAGSKTIKMTRGTAGTNLFISKLEIDRLPVDITLNVESGKDIATELAAAVEGKVVGNITINLAEGGEYTVGSSLVAPASFTLNGNGATITAPAELAAAMITTPAGDLAEWNSVDFSINNVTIKGLAQAVFASAGKNYLYNAFTIDNVVAECTASIVFDFRKGGVAKDFTIQYSTFYAPVATNNSFYSSQSAQKATEAPDVTLQTFTLKNSTFYNYAYTKNFFTHRQSNQTWLAFTLVDNIFVNCGKSGQVVKGVNQGQNGANPTWVINGNIFNFDGADTSAAESTGDDEEPVQNSIVGVVTFADAAAGDFNGTFTYPFGTTAPESLGGDARWTITIAEGEDLSSIESIAVVAAQKDGKFFIDGKLVIVRNGRQFNANGQILK